MPLSLQEQFETVGAVTVFGRLFSLDRIRTDYLERVEQPIPTQDMQALSGLTREMDRLLQEARSHTESLSRIFFRHGEEEELEKRYKRILWTDALTGDQKLQLELTISRYDDNPRYFCLDSLDRVWTEVEAERETLATEMTAIHSGGSAAGDLSSRFLCNMGAACIVGGLFAPPPTNIVGVGVGLLMIGQVYAMGEEC